MSDVFLSVMQRVSLTRAEATTLLRDVLEGRLTEIQQAGLLVALAAKGETVEEIAGFVDVMREQMTSVPLDVDAVDGCGTGGDGSGTFNISTAACLMAAACGLPIVKHGNRAVSSSCGSADLLEQLGYTFPENVKSAQQRFEESNFVFLFAPAFHPAMARVRNVRKELRVRTLFNLLGPLSNPAEVKRQIIGVYSKELLGRIGDVAVATGSKRLLVVHSLDGMDEFSISAPTEVREWNEGSWREYSISPEDVGLIRSGRATITGGNAEYNVLLVRQALSGATGPVTEVVVFNAAALLYIGGLVDSIRDGVALLREQLKKRMFLEWVDTLCKGSANAH